jgi:hypothetical protein
MGFGKLKNRLLLKKKEFYFCEEYFDNIEALSCSKILDIFTKKSFKKGFLEETSLIMKLNIVILTPDI